MKKTDIINVYLANLSILNTKLHNLHWNVVGPQFMHAHKTTEEIYENLFEKFDEVAELLKIMGGCPLATTKAYLDAATIEEIEPKDFTVKEVMEIVKADLCAMKKMATDVRNCADEDGDFTTVALFEDHVAYFAQQIWFVASSLK